MSASSVPPVHTLIWLSVRPIIKVVLPAMAGFSLAKAGLFPPSGSRAASQIILNITLPSLLFSKIVPSFTSENIQAIGPIVLVALVYMGLSMIFGAIVRTVFPCPRNFRWGIIAAATWSNWGDLPTSVVQTICASSPFGGTADADLAIAYVAIFILVFYVTFFPLQGIKFIEMDYTHPPKEIDEETAEALGHGKWWRLKAAQHHTRRFGQRITRRKAVTKNATSDDAALPTRTNLEALDAPTASTVVEETEKDVSSRPRSRSTHVRPIGMEEIRRVPTNRSLKTPSVREMAGAAAAASIRDTSQHNRRSFRNQQRLLKEEREKLQTIMGSRAGSRANSVFGELDGDAIDDRDTESEDAVSVEQVKQENEKMDEEAAKPKPMWKKILIGFRQFALSLLTPPTISLVSAIVIALVDDLKALFTYVPGNSFNPVAPDGNPPLSILLDTTTFLGNASVPLGLMVLGSALARMRLPRPLSRLPLGSIISLALAKLVLLPIIGFLFVQALTFQTGLIDPENKVLRFVMIFFSVVPTATTQVALTQIYAPEDGESNSDILSAYLIIQYMIFVFSSVILTSFTLSRLF